jgi:hypothetical protein
LLAHLAQLRDLTWLAERASVAPDLIPLLSGPPGDQFREHLHSLGTQNAALVADARAR